jgi:hypothetical protein
MILLLTISLLGGGVRTVLENAGASAVHAKNIVAIIDFFIVYNFGLWINNFFGFGDYRILVVSCYLKDVQKIKMMHEINSLNIAFDESTFPGA